MNAEQLDWVDLLEEEDREVEEDKGKLIARRIKCPDGTILHSFNGRYVDHTQEDGQYFALDFNGYTSRVVGDISLLEDCNVYETDVIEEIREVYYWKPSRIEDNQYPEYILVKNLPNLEIHNILELVQGRKVFSGLESLLIRELHYRKRTQIYIGECEYE